MATLFDAIQDGLSNGDDWDTIVDDVLDTYSDDDTLTADKVIADMKAQLDGKALPFDLVDADWAAIKTALQKALGDEPAADELDRATRLAQQLKEHML